VILSSESKDVTVRKRSELVQQHAAPSRFVFGSVSYPSRARRLFVQQKRFMSPIIRPQPERFHVSLPT
jgi:hypothetical protein